MPNSQIVFIISVMILTYMFCNKIYKLGRRTRDADNSEEILDNVKTANDARDRLATDADYASRMSDKFRRK